MTEVTALITVPMGFGLGEGPGDGVGPRTGAGEAPGEGDGVEETGVGVGATGVEPTPPGLPVTGRVARPPGRIAPPVERMPMRGAATPGTTRPCAPAPPVPGRVATDCATGITGITGTVLPVRFPFRAARAPPPDATPGASGPALGAGGPAKIWPSTPS